MPKRAVVVEDMEVVARALSSILNLDGFDEVKVLTDPRDAVRLVKTSDPDLLVLDMRMPHLNGAQVIAALGKRAGARPGILVYTATPRDEVDAQLAKTGHRYDAFLSKPAGLKEMKEAIRRALASVDAP